MNDLLKKLKAQRENGGAAAAAPTARPSAFDMMEEMTRRTIGPAQRVMIDNALVVEDEGLRFDDVKLTRVGLVIPPDGISRETGKRLFGLLLSMEGSIHWWLGDLLADGENRQWGETYREACEEYGRDYATLRDYAWIARNVNLSFRNDKLTFTHHRHVAKMDAAGQSLWIETAARLDWPVSKMKGYISLLDGWDVETQRQWLAVVERDGLTVEALRDEINKARGVQQLQPVNHAKSVKTQIARTKFLANAVEKYGVDLAGMDDAGRESALAAAREVMALAEAVLRGGE